MLFRSVVLDTWDECSRGGSGRTFDWRLAINAVKNVRVVIAGGLNCSNVTCALKMLRPYAVDISSGIETDGRKDDTKIGQFVKTVRAFK